MLNDESSDVACDITGKGECGSLGQIMFIKHGLMKFESFPSAAFTVSWNLNLVQNQFSQIQPASTDISSAVKYQESRH